MYTTNTVVPTLSEHGWVREPAAMADFLMAHFFESDVVQSEIYPGAVANIQGLMQKHSNNIDGLVRDLESVLSVYFSRHFPEGASCTVINYVNPKEPESNSVTLRVFISYTVDGVEYSVGREISKVNSKFQIVLNINNEGVSNA